MSTENETREQLKRAVQAIKDLRTRLEHTEGARREPIAIIGAACRFAGGASSPDAFWQLLQNQVDAIIEPPDGRWDNDALYSEDKDAPGKLYTRYGGFLSDLDRFDAAFFGISPREATYMDPQQRLMLEVAWEAFDDAGRPLDTLGGSPTGVFVGAHNQSSDYYLMQTADLEDIDMYTGTGTAHAVLSGRIAYLYDLQGPNLVVDTACSSSLVALHLAVQSLRSGESDLALAGGVNLMISPEFTMTAARMHLLSPDGRCKTFDARADGYVRGEGCGAIVLKRLSDALRDQDRILAVIRGTAMNQDGHSNGLTAPNGLSQQAVIRQALQNAGVQPAQVRYVETHGTGTALGDPIEVEALAATYGQTAGTDQPCWLGSVKSNIGHLEGAAGIAGLIKTMLCLQHGEIPANLHFQELNPHITLDGTRLQIAANPCAWDASGEPRRAGLSSFGWSGTNVHVILEEAPAAVDAPQPEAAANAIYLLPISARAPGALQALAGQYAQLLSETSRPADVCQAAAARRSHLNERLAVAGRSAEELVAGLEAYTRGEERTNLRTGSPPDGRLPGLVMVFSGQGGHWAGMGRAFYDSEPVFQAEIDTIERAIAPYVDWSLREQILAVESQSRLDETDVMQPVLFAYQAGMAALWRSWGVEPEAVTGHSVGEVTAAYVSGVLSLADAARLICMRSRLMRRVSGKGAMASIGLPPEQTEALLAGYIDRVTVAVMNSPESTVISGDPEAVEAVMAAAHAKDIFCRKVNITVATHSPQMDSLRSELETALGEIRPQSGSIPFYSTVTGEKIDGNNLNASYWGRNLRQPVRFADAVRSLVRDNFGIFLEISPHPLLAQPIEQMAQWLETTPQVRVITTGRRKEDERLNLGAALGALYAAGVAPDWQKVLPPGDSRNIPLPSYPWQRKRYWIRAENRTADPLAKRLFHIEWQPAAAPAVKTPGAGGRWLVFDDPSDPARSGQLLANALAALPGVQAIRVLPGAQFRQVGVDRYEINPHRADDYRSLLATISGQAGGLRGVAFLWGAGAPETNEWTPERLQEVQRLQLNGALFLTQALAVAAWPDGQSPRLWFLTRRAQPVAGERPTGLASAPLWGFGRVLASEHPELWGGCLDFDALNPEQILPDILTGVDLQIGYRRGQRFAAQISRIEPLPPVAAPAIRSDATYLITGGLGGLGLQAAGWLVERGAQSLALVGRTQGSAEARAAVQTLIERGAQVRTYQADISNAADTRRLLEEIAAGLPPLCGVIHTAGVVEDSLIDRLDWPTFERVLSAKMAGAWNLHQLTAGLPLEVFILYSSIASFVGTPGQANYAAANAFLDALAHERRAAGLPGLSINWGPWARVGMAIKGERLEVLSRSGIEPFQPEKGLEALSRLWLSGLAQAAFASIDWKKFTAQRPNSASSWYFQAMQPQAFTQLERTEETPPESLVDTLTAIEPAARADRLHEFITQVVTQVLRYDDANHVPPDQGFFQIGMDSLMAVELKNRLQNSFNRNLRTTLAFDYPSINLLTRYLLSELFPSTPQPVEPAVPDTDPAASLDGLSREEVQSMLDDELRILEEDL